MQADEKFEGWFIVELMGRKKTAGFVSEQTVAGAGFLRIDVPETEKQPKVTQFFRPETVYALTPTTEDVARRVARHYRPEPVYAFEIAEPEPSPPALIHRIDDSFGDYMDRLDDDR